MYIYAMYVRILFEHGHRNPVKFGNGSVMTKHFPTSYRYKIAVVIFNVIVAKYHQLDTDWPFVET